MGLKGVWKEASFLSERNVINFWRHVSGNWKILITYFRHLDRGRLIPTQGRFPVKKVLNDWKGIARMPFANEQNLWSSMESVPGHNKCMECHRRQLKYRVDQCVWKQWCILVLCHFPWLLYCLTNMIDVFCLYLCKIDIFKAHPASYLCFTSTQVLFNRYEATNWNRSLPNGNQTSVVLKKTNSTFVECNATMMIFKCFISKPIDAELCLFPVGYIEKRKFLISYCDFFLKQKSVECQHLGNPINSKCWWWNRKELRAVWKYLSARWWSVIEVGARKG